MIEQNKQELKTLEDLLVRQIQLKKKYRDLGEQYSDYSKEEYNKDKLLSYEYYEESQANYNIANGIDSCIRATLELMWNSELKDVTSKYKGMF